MPRFTVFIRNQSSKALLLGLTLGLAGVSAQQFPEVPRTREQPEEKRLPSGKLQSEEILRADHESNLKDLEKMQKLLEGIEEELKKNDRHVLSLKAMKDLEEIEKMARRVRGRMKRF